MKISLAKALVYKKRVEQEVARRKETLLNSCVVTSPEAIHPDIITDLDRRFAKAEADWLDAKEHLVNVKVILQESCKSIRGKIFQLSELKDEAATFGSISHTHTPSKVDISSSYNGNKNYVAFVMSTYDQSAKIKKTQAAIDTLQSEIDAFNHTTEIELPDFTL